MQGKGMNRLVVLFVFAALMALLVAGCAAPAPAEDAGSEATTEDATAEESTEPMEGGTLIVARAADAKGLDPHKQTAFTSFRLLELIYEPLLGLNENLEVEANLAESWSWSEDGLTLTMKLQPDVKFHNGDGMTSSDVKFSYERILNEETGSAARSYFTGIQSIETPDDNTVVFTLGQPNVSILAAMTNVNSAIVSEAVVSSEDPSQVTVGTGPFSLESWEPDQVTMLKANADYWREGLPKVDAIEMRIIPDESSILASLRAGEVDWALINDPTVGVLAASVDSDLVLERTPALAYHVMQINSGRAPFDDERVRQAVSCAIDRQQVVDTASLGEGQVTAPATAPFYAAPLNELTCYEKDLEKAKQLLADAGYADGFSFKVMAATDEPPTAISEAQNIQAQLAEIGIEIEIEPLELGVYVDRWLATDYDGAIALNGGNPDPDIMFYRYWHSTGNLNSVAAYTTPEIDALLDEGRLAQDPNERQAIYVDVQKMLADAAPWVWLYVGYEYRGMQPYVKDFTPMPNASIKYLRDVWLDK